MGSTGGTQEGEAIRDAILAAALDADLITVRANLGRFAADIFTRSGTYLHAGGLIVGPDRAAGASPSGNGSDETVAVSVLLRVAAQLVGGAMLLFEHRQTYAAAALLRQLVEVEYLGWAFEARTGEGQRWLRSDYDERRKFFSPSKLQKAAQGRFRGVDYSYHCEHGGHPVPGPANLLLKGDDALAQLMIADLLGHAGRTWDHIVGWARDASHGDLVLRHREEMLKRFVAWKETDPLANLPPPPLPERQ